MKVAPLNDWNGTSLRRHLNGTCTESSIHCSLSFIFGLTAHVASNEDEGCNINESGANKRPRLDTASSSNDDVRYSN